MIILPTIENRHVLRDGQNLENILTIVNIINSKYDFEILIKNIKMSYIPIPSNTILNELRQNNSQYDTKTADDVYDFIIKRMKDLSKVGRRNFIVYFPSKSHKDHKPLTHIDHNMKDDISPVIWTILKKKLLTDGFRIITFHEIYDIWTSKDKMDQVYLGFIVNIRWKQEENSCVIV
jgi:hypothetical protein